MSTNAGSLVGDSLIVVSTVWMALTLHYHWPERWMRWLISPAASYVVGTTLTVSGGR